MSDFAVLQASMALQRISNRRKARYSDPPLPWTRKSAHSIGGLVAVGFNVSLRAA